MAEMARLQYGRLTEAWKGEATDFTPLLKDQLDVLGAEIGVDLASVGESEVLTTGGRRIDIVAQGTDGSEFVVENQYGKGDHDHLTRGLAYAVARHARGLVVVAEEHRDEFRAVAQYLNELAELDSEHGIAVWLVEVKAVRIGDSAWAPLFSAVVEPNSFTAEVEKAKQQAGPVTKAELFEMFASEEALQAAQAVMTHWEKAGHRVRLGPGHAVLEAQGPSKSGRRSVVAIHPDGSVFVPFGSYSGQNSGIPIEALTTEQFLTSANEMFGFRPGQKQARTAPGWLGSATTQALIDFCEKVAEEYSRAPDLQIA